MRDKRGTRILNSKFINKNMLNSKCSQITIWIIIAIVIVALVILLFALKVPKKFISPSTPAIQLQACAEKELKKIVENVSRHGGSISPELFFMYKGEKVEYL